MLLLCSLISALCMWLALWLLTRRERAVSLKPVLLLSFASCLLTYFAVLFLGSWGLAVVMAGLIVSMVHFLLLSWGKSILAAVVWLLSQVGFGWFVSPIF